MKNALIIADSGPIFSLAIIDELELLNKIFADIKISKAVWEEISLNKNTDFYHRIELFFTDKIVEIKSVNNLISIMDYGESESLILYKELRANFLLIDDKKARNIAENYNANCIGTLGILSIAKSQGLIKNLRPLFQTFLSHERYYSLNLLNYLLETHDESKLTT